MRCKRFRLAGFLALVFAWDVQAQQPCMHLDTQLVAAEQLLEHQRGLLAAAGARDDAPALVVATLASRSLQFPWLECRDIEPPAPVPVSARTLALAQRAADAGRESPAALFTLLAHPGLINDPRQRDALHARLLELDRGNLAVWMIALEAAEQSQDDVRLDALLADAAQASTRIDRYHAEVLRWFVDVPGDAPPAAELAPLSERQIAKLEPLDRGQQHAIVGELAATLGYPVDDAFTAACQPARARQWSETRAQHCRTLAVLLLDHPDTETDVRNGLGVLRPLATDGDDKILLFDWIRTTTWQSSAIRDVQQELGADVFRIQLVLHRARAGIGETAARLGLLGTYGVATEPPADFGTQ